MFEKLMYQEERAERSPKYPKIFVGQPYDLDLAAFRATVQSLEQSARQGDVDSIFELFESLHMGYTRPKTTFPPVEAPHA